MAKSLNTNYSIIGKYERDEVAPSINVIKKLGDALEVSLDYLAGDAKKLLLIKKNEAHT